MQNLRSIYLGIGVAQALALIIGAIICVLLPKAQLSANGVHPGGVQVFSGVVRPYDVSVWATQPILVGPIHLTISVSNMATGGPVPDATVRVSGRGPGGNPSQSLGSVLASMVLADANWYSVDVPVEKAGKWTFTLAVVSSLGEGTADFPVKVQGTGGVNWGILGVLVVILALVAWTALSWRLWKRRRPAPQDRARRK